MQKRQETIKNKALVYFELAGKRHAIESNEVEAKKVCLRVRKEQSTNVVFDGDKICYTIVVYNDSCMDLCDLDFSDPLDNDVQYERNTFRVNYECKNPQINGRTLCYHIDRLRPYEQMIITFDTKVM